MAKCIPSVDTVVRLLKQSENLAEDSKLAVLILRDIQAELAECAASMKKCATLDHIFWMNDGDRTVADVLSDLSKTEPEGMVEWPSMKPIPESAPKGGLQAGTKPCSH